MLYVNFGWNWHSVSGGKCLKLCSAFLLGCYRYPCGPEFEQTWIPFMQEWVVQSLLESDPVSKSEEDENVK